MRSQKYCTDQMLVLIFPLTKIRGTNNLVAWVSCAELVSSLEKTLPRPLHHFFFTPKCCSFLYVNIYPVKLG